MKHLPSPPPAITPTEYLVQPKIADAYRYLGVCPRSQTMISFSLTHNAPILFILPCGTWSCRVCAEVKIKKLSHGVMRAEPNRLLTLTVNPALYASRKEAWEQTRKQVPILIRQLRKRFGDIEYLRVTEVTAAGWPHYHLLVRSGFLPQPVVKRMWAELTGAYIVDLRQVTKSWSAYKYLVKYLSKLHRLEWTNRHVSVSKNFIPKEESDDYEPIEHDEGEFINEHPAAVVTDRFAHHCLKRLSNNAHLVVPIESYRGFGDLQSRADAITEANEHRDSRPSSGVRPPSTQQLCRKPT